MAVESFLLRLLYGAWGPLSPIVKAYHLYAVGKEPPVLPDDLVQSLRNLGHLLA